MSNRPLAITQRQIQAAIRAAKAEGAPYVDVKVSDAVMRVPLADHTKEAQPVDGEKKWHL